MYMEHSQVPQHLKNDRIYQSVLPVCRYMIRLRYSLLQLSYDAMFENMLTGLPIARAMVRLELVQTQWLRNIDLALADIVSDYHGRTRPQPVLRRTSSICSVPQNHS